MSTLRRNSYSIKFKVSVVEWHHNNEASLHKTAKRFSIDRKRVCEWCQKYSVLKGQTSGALGKHRHINHGKPLSLELDQKVFEFLEDERSEGRAVLNQLLKTEALQIAGGLKLEGSGQAVAG